MQNGLPRFPAGADVLGKPQEPNLALEGWVASPEQEEVAYREWMHMTTPE